MKSKINKKTLLGENHNKGFVWLNRYSDTENTDDIGRWARIGYYNGFMISWITGYVKEDGKLHERKTGICNLFITHLQFPTSSNQGGEVKNFDTIEEAKKYTIEMFTDFKKLINKSSDLKLLGIEDVNNVLIKEKINRYIRECKIMAGLAKEKGHTHSEACSDAMAFAYMTCLELFNDNI